ncbi:hypothetical protein ABPG74_005270 [Tetrahymena malaccensis]
MNSINKDTLNSKGQETNHFKQFFSNSIPNARYSLSIHSNPQSTLSISQVEKEQKQRRIDLDNFSKHITTSPSRLHLSKNENSYITSTNNNTILNTKNNSVASNNNATYLNDSKFANLQDSISSLKNNQALQEQSLVGSINNNSRTQNQSNINSRTLQLQRSFFFNGPERFENDKNHNYFGRSQINPMVNTHKYETSQAEDIKYYKIFQETEKKFDDSKLYLKTDSNYLKAPKERIEELQEVKKNQQLLQEWKVEHQQKSKQYKLAKAAFKSGISHIDGPLDNDTQIYSNEHKNFIKKENDELNRRNVRLSYIEKFVTTNPAIYFDNSQQSGLFEKKRQNFPHQVDDFQNNFMRKQKSELALNRNSQTFDRLFGHNLQDQKNIINSQRSKFLMSKDLYGKQHNIVNNTLNPSLKYL